MAETALAPTNGARGLARYSEDEIELIKSQIAKGASDGELQMFLAVAGRLGLDPFSRQIYLVKYQNQPAFIHVSIDGLRLIAERSGRWQGTVGPYWCGPDGIWREVWLEQGPPAAAKVGVLRLGCRQPIWGVATWKSCAKDGPLWKGRQDEMLAKCAEGKAIRRAFPHEMAAVEQPEAIAVDPETGEVIDAEVMEEERPALAPTGADTPKPAAKSVDARMRLANEHLAGALRAASLDHRDVDLIGRVIAAALGRSVDSAASLTAADRERLAKWVAGHADEVAAIQVDVQREREADAAEADEPFEEGGDDLQLTGAQERAREAVVNAESGTFAQRQGL